MKALLQKYSTPVVVTYLCTGAIIAWANETNGSKAMESVRLHASTLAVVLLLFSYVLLCCLYPILFLTAFYVLAGLAIYGGIYVVLSMWLDET